MTKTEFKAIVEDGINRGRAFMAVKIQEVGFPAPIVIVVPAEIADNKIRDYMKFTDDDLVFKNTGNKIEDVLLTGNLNDLNWFAY